MINISFGRICTFCKNRTFILCKNKVQYVTKTDNPPNLQECLPIEDFWSILKGKVYEKNWQAKTLHQLHLRIRKCLREVAMNLEKRLFESTRPRLSKIKSHGLPEDN